MDNRFLDTFLSPILVGSSTMLWLRVYVPKILESVGAFLSLHSLPLYLIHWVGGALSVISQVLERVTLIQTGTSGAILVGGVK
jgi:hypothetical protein